MNDPRARGEAIEMLQHTEVTTDPDPSAISNHDKARDAPESMQPTDGKLDISSEALATAKEGPATEEEPEHTRRLLRKLDYQILPVALLLYAASFVDRAAIGYARAAGLMKDLKLTDGKYAFATSIFFVCYALFEVPSNVALRAYGARRWIPGMALMWGLCQLVTAFVHNFTALSIVRALLGVFEAAILPGMMALITFVYPPSAVQVRFGALVACNAFFVSFSGLLAYAVCHIESHTFQGWRWLFVIEGIITMLLSIPAYFGLVSSIDEARGFTEQEKAYLKDRVEWDRGRRDRIETGRGRKKHIVAACKDFKIWILIVAFLGFTCPTYSVALALPSLLKLKLHHGVLASQLLTVPVYSFAATWVFIVSVISDRTKKRALLQGICAGVSCIGWSIGYASENAKVQYFAFFIASSGSFSTLPCIVALLSQNLAGQTKRAAGIALLISVGGLAALLASNLAPNKDAPRFAVLYKVNIAGNLVTVVATGAAVGWLRRKNRLKAEYREALAESKTILTAEELDEMGDESPYFIYRF